MALGAHDVRESRTAPLENVDAQQQLQNGPRGHYLQLGGAERSRRSREVGGKPSLRRGLQRRGDPPKDGGGAWEESNTESRWGDGNKDAGNSENSSSSGGGNAYGDYGSYMGSAGSRSKGGNSASTETGGGSNSNSYGSYGGGDSTSGGYDNYGSASGNGYSESGRSSSYSTGGYDSYGSSSSTSTAGGYDSYGSASSYGSDSGSYSSVWGAKGGSSSSDFLSKLQAPTMPTANLGLIPAICLLLLSTLTGMLITAHRMEHNPEGTFANCCRVSLHTVRCAFKVVYNLYHCRLGEIPPALFASELEEDEYTEEEMERMRLRPGIERALDVEHRKTLRKVGVEMGKIKVKKKKGGGQSESSAESMQR
ncbi:hypothetical protein ACHAXT_011730 [Thalassiosira profunda]